MTQHIVMFLISACVGVAIEVFFTSIAEYKRTKDHRLEGHSYLWMFPLYGMAYVIFVFAWPYIADYNFALRGIFYVLLLYLLEYAYGDFIRRFFGASPWEHKYHKSKWNVHGHIRLDYAPLWFLFTLLLEQLFVHLKIV